MNENELNQIINVIWNSDKKKTHGSKLSGIRLFKVQLSKKYVFSVKLWTASYKLNQYDAVEENKK